MGLMLLFNQPGVAGTPFSAGPATNLFFLFNESGRAATSIPVNVGVTAPGYHAFDLLSGPRSAMWRSASAAVTEIGYAYGSDVGISYAVISRADLLVSAAGKQVIGRQRDSGGAWSDIPGFNLNPIMASQLVGPRSQDLVMPAVATSLRGVALRSAPYSGSEASMFSKLYAGGAFAFSAPPNLNPSWTDYPPETYVTPLRGTMPYEVERSFSLAFFGVQQSEYVQFRRYDWAYEPFFLYDSTGDIWKWKLEHVILTGLTATMNEVNTYTLQLDFYRLRHYDA
jgi:hypothetical protein